MAVLPLGEKPHLVQKLELLYHGHLYGFMDWFDLMLHGLPLTAAIILIAFTLLRRGN